MENVSESYQGQFGEFTITKSDRNSVIIYRSALAIAALCFSLGALLVLLQPNNPEIVNWLQTKMEGAKNTPNFSIEEKIPKN